MESLEQHYASTWVKPGGGSRVSWTPGRKIFPPGKLRALAKHLGRVHQDVAATWCVFFAPQKKKTWMLLV